MDEPPRIQFRHPRAILCEGEGDSAFFRHLIATRNLPPFDIFSPGAPYTEDGAVEGYDDMLTSFAAGTGFRSLVGIIVQGDNDDNPSAKFKRIAEKIQSAEGYVAPRAPLEVVRANGRPAVVVLMFPWTDELGALETLCLPSAERANPGVKKCVDDHFRCAGISTWPLVKQHKMRLRCMIASTCKTDPYTSLRYAWSRSETLIPLDDGCFHRLAGFLQNFDEYVGHV